MTQSSIIEILSHHIQSELASGRSPTALAPDFPLIQSGLIDSLSLFTLITFIEERFQIRIQPDEIVLENFVTLAAIEQFVRGKQPRL
jgi:acyl carrier protein